jgi:sugar phosphate isomerase/epimerase
MGMHPLSRRHFLQAIGAASLAGIARDASVAAGPGTGRKMTMDLVCGNLGVNVDLPTAITLAHQNGFESVAPEAGYLGRLSDSQLSEFIGDLKGKGLTWGAAGLPVDFRGEDAAFREGMAALPALAANLKRAGASRVGTWISPGHNRIPYVANFRQHARRLREVAVVLGDQGLRLGLEYVGPKTAWTASRYPFIHTMAEMRELIAEIGRDHVGLVLDSWHWYTAGETAADIRGLTGRDVIACDLNDAPRSVPVDQQRDGVRELPCATGVIDLKAFLTALAAIGYDGPVRAEPFNATVRTLPPEAAVAATARAMKRAFALLG